MLRQAYDIGRSGRTLTWWLAATTTLSIACIVAYAYAIAYPEVLSVSDMDIGAIEGIELAYSSVSIVTAVLTLRWIYRANANAHRLASDLTISPRWSVGWFFVPVAFLWMPFFAVRETWAASVDPDAWRSVRTPAVLVAWWVFWVASSSLDWIMVGVTWDVFGEDLAVYLPSYIVTNIAGIAATLALIRMIGTLSRVQAHTLMRHTFA